MSEDAGTSQSARLLKEAQETIRTKGESALTNAQVVMVVRDLYSGDRCEYCGSSDGVHKIVTRHDGKPARCSAGDALVLATRLERAMEIVRAADRLADAAEVWAGSEPNMPSHRESEAEFDDALNAYRKLAGSGAR
jgi:hypothetical protein